MRSICVRRTPVRARNRQLSLPTCRPEGRRRASACCRRRACSGRRSRRGQLGKSIARYPLDRLAFAIQHGTVVDELQSQQALQLLHAPHKRVDRTARHPSRPLVNPDQDELSCRRSRPAVSGTPWASIRRMKASVSSSTRPLSSFESGRSAAKIQRRASVGS